MFPTKGLSLLRAKWDSKHFWHLSTAHMDVVSNRQAVCIATRPSNPKAMPTCVARARDCINNTHTHITRARHMSDSYGAFLTCSPRRTRTKEKHKMRAPRRVSGKPRGLCSPCVGRRTMRTRGFDALRCALRVAGILLTFISSHCARRGICLSVRSRVYVCGCARSFISSLSVHTIYKHTRRHTYIYIYI